MQIPHAIFAPWPPEFRIGGSEEKHRLCGLQDSVKKFVAFIERPPQRDGDWAYQTLKIDVDQSIEPAWTAGGAVSGIEQALESFKGLCSIKHVYLSGDMVRKMVVGGVVPEVEARRFEEYRNGFQEELRRKTSVEWTFGTVVLAR